MVAVVVYSAADPTRVDFKTENELKGLCCSITIAQNCEHASE
jgi:hypothetical protein